MRRRVGSYGGGREEEEEENGFREVLEQYSSSRVF